MKLKLVLSFLVFALALCAAGAGVLPQASGDPITMTTVRGEVATYQGSGLYRYNPVTVAREGVVWDIIDLVLALPLLGTAMLLSQRNSLRGRLLLAGMLFYFTYKYVQYATMVAFNPLFLIYVAIFALSAVAFFLNLRDIDIPDLPSHIALGFPHRLTIGFSFAMSGVLLLLWCSRIVAFTLADRFPNDLAGVTTLETQALDLGMVVPLLLASGVLLWRRSAWAYVLSGVSVSFGLVMSITLPAWIVVPLLREGRIHPIEASPLLVLCMIGVYIAGQFFRHVQEPLASLPVSNAAT